ncbi:MAG: hypothetical protein ACMG6E_09410, partial [Candidatus Roizmanbacteria bacterium]
AEYARAIEDPDEYGEFRKIFATEEAEDHVINIRTALAEFAFMCTQENPGKTVEEIAAEIRDPEVFFDPALYYRVVEEEYGFNIFTLILVKKEFILEPPKYVKQYVRSKRNPENRTIVVVKLMPPNSDKNKMPQCELVGPKIKNKLHFTFHQEPNKASGERRLTITEKFEKASSLITRSIIVSAKMEQVDKQAVQQRVSVTSNVSKQINLPQELLDAVISQKIDSNGRTRILNIQLQDYEPISLVVEPMEPLNAPAGEPVATSYANFKIFAEDFEVTDLRYTPEFHLVQTYETESAIPASIVGAWFLLQGFEMYVLLQPCSWDENIFKRLKYGAPYEIKTVESPTERLIRLQAVLVVFVQLAKRLFFLSMLSPDDFIQQHTTVVPKKYFTVADTRQLLPPDATINFETFLKYCQDSYPGLFEGNALALDSGEMQISLLLRLVTFDKQIKNEALMTRTTKQPLGVTDRFTKFPPFIERFFVSPNDFRIHGNHQMLFLSVERFNMETDIAAVEDEKIYTKIVTTTMSARASPYFYLYRERYVYMVQ